MSLQVYVGNYPKTFTPDDILDLFRDYNGLELKKFIHKDKKSFSFLQCLDKEQVIEVVSSMQGINVGGRNLIVRASDGDLHSLILKSLRDDDVHNEHRIYGSHSDLSKSKSNHGNNFQSPIIKQEETSDIKNEGPYGVRLKHPTLSAPKQNDYDFQRASNNHQSKVSPNSEGNFRSNPIREDFLNDSGIATDSQAYHKSNSIAQSSPKSGSSFLRYPHQFAKGYSPHRKNVTDTDSGIYNRGSGDSIDVHQTAVDYEYSNSRKAYSSSNNHQDSAIRQHRPRDWNDSSQNREEDAYPTESNSDSSYQASATYPSQRGYNDYQDRDYEQSNPNFGYSAYHSKDSGFLRGTSSNYRNGQQNVGAYRQTSSIPSHDKNDSVRHSASNSASSNRQHYSSTQDSALEARQTDFQDKDASTDNLFYVSVANFPLYTTVEDLYELLEDFDPVEIIMICNLPRGDKKPTEAIICFQTQDQATDAILNFDNTIYCGRALIVTDATDISMVPTLLSLGRSRNA